MDNQINLQKKTINSIVQQQQYRNIIFDLGGVLIYFKPRELIETIFKDRLEKPFNLVDAVHTSQWLDMDRGLLEPEQVAVELAHRFDQNDLYTFLTNIPHYLNPLHEGLEIMHAVQAQGYNTYVLSNMAHFTYQKIRDYEFLKTFDGHIYSCHVNAAKPDQAIYQALLGKYGLNPVESIFIDDLEININAGKMLGIDGIICSDHTHVVKELQRKGVL